MKEESWWQSLGGVESLRLRLYPFLADMSDIHRFFGIWKAVISLQYQ